MKTSAEIAADALLPPIKAIVDEQLKNKYGCVPHGTIVIDLEPVRKAVAWDVEEAYLNFADYLDKNRYAIMWHINHKLHQRSRHYVEAWYIWDDYKTVNLYLGFR